MATSSAVPSPIVITGGSSEMVTVVFCIVFPPVPENLAIALSTLDAGPATSPTAVFPSSKFNSAAVVVTAAAPSVVN